jgi:hypothetical protein
LAFLLPYTLINERSFPAAQAAPLISEFFLQLRQLALFPLLLVLFLPLLALPQTLHASAAPLS